MRFVRVEPRRRVGLFLLGLLAGLPRVNCWTIAEPAGKHPAKTLGRRLPSRAWNRLSAGVGAKGHRWYDWALIDIAVADAEGGGTVGGQALLVRRSISTGELAFYRCNFHSVQG